MAEQGGGGEAAEGGEMAVDRRMATEADTGCSDKERFVLELEFVQGLANPHYLNWLAQNKYFADPAFIQYLQYLQYWREPAYRKFLIYPQTLYFLELLQSETFRAAIANPGAKEMVHRQQLYFWRYFRGNRIKEELAAAGEDPPAAGEAADSIMADANGAA
mmetsp:Transcript_26670/g.69170  ORF Transcript_26670/g.69170 Transcript_26670/m.69170 type:complete len:161 (-) Transcript_26670:39-521(-)